MTSKTTKEPSMQRTSYIRLIDGNGRQVFAGTEQECINWITASRTHRVKEYISVGMPQEWWRVTTR